MIRRQNLLYLFYGHAILVSSFVSEFFRPQRIRRACSSRLLAETTFIVPIFPLRKVPRLPTEVLTLNLYEERYLDLAERVLAASPAEKLFGAVYSSNRPQMVKGGKGPIVPIIREGDIGVIFHVDEYEDATMPTRGGDSRRRIRLIGRGRCRFQVEQVLHNGFGGTIEENLDPLLYILAKVSTLVDETLSDDDAEESVKLVADALERLPKQDEDEILLKALTLRTFDEVFLGSSPLTKPEREELLSFGCASFLIGESSATRERLACLECTSTLERLRSL